MFNTSSTKVTQKQKKYLSGMSGSEHVTVSSLDPIDWRDVCQLSGLGQVSIRMLTCVTNRRRRAKSTTIEILNDGCPFRE